MAETDTPELTPVTKARLGATIGFSGISDVGGYIISDERQPTLTGSKKYDTFLTFINDVSIIAASIRLFANLISKAEWQAVPANDSDEAKAIAEQVEAMMADHLTPWHRIIRKLVMYRFYGFVLMEWTAKKRDDGTIGMLEVKHRPQKTINRWDVDPDGNVQGVWQYDANYQEVYLPRDRLIYAVDDLFTDNPEGMGLLRHAARHVERLKAYESIEETGFENDVRGMPVAYAPLKELMSQGVDKYTKAKAVLTSFIKGHIRSKKSGLMLDSETYRSTDDGQTPSSVRKWQAEIMNGDATSFEALSKAITRAGQEIARLMGTEHLMLGSDGVGSLALAKSKVGTFYITVISTQTEIVEVVEADWLGPLADMNGWAEELLPSLQCEEVRDEDITQITEALRNMSNAGAVLSPDDEAVAEVYSMLGLTPPDPSLRPDLSLMPGASEVDLIDPTKMPKTPEAPTPAQAQRETKKRWIMSRKAKNKGKY